MAQVKHGVSCFERYPTVRVFFCNIADILLALAALIDAPVMLSLVRIVNGSKDWYERGLKSHA